MAQPSDQHSQEQGQPASEDPSHAKQHPNTVHHIRYQLRRLTEDILSHGRHPLADSSSGTGISENPNSQASNSGDNDSGNGPKSNGTPPQPVKPMPSGVSSDLIKPGGWDEMCLGLWVQDREMRRRGIPARCYGIAVARIYKSNARLNPAAINRNTVLVTVRDSQLYAGSKHTTSSETSTPNPHEKTLLEKQFDTLKSILDPNRASKVIDLGNYYLKRVARFGAKVVESQVNEFERW